MKAIAIHGMEINEDALNYFHEIIALLKNENIEISFTRKFFKRNQHIVSERTSIIDEIVNVDYIFSLGGDGTFLETILLVGAAEVPVLGINMGRLGFLSSISKEQINESLQFFFKGKFEIENRSLLQIELEKHDPLLFDGKFFALNECAILRQDTSSMIKVKAFVNDQYLNTYWADGLMVATPTGSTGYSLSCGGPLMMPDSKDFVITPVSPHNLNVRPLIFSDDSILKFEIETRSKNYLISLDSRSAAIENHIGLTIKKGDFKAHTIKIEGVNFPETIRNKLGWGYDKRN